MGLANAQRTLEYLRVFTEFFSQPQYSDVVVIFGVMNEALVGTIGKSQMTSFYLKAHDMIREITGTGAGKGPYISIHDGFQGISSWSNFLSGSDRIVLDSHPYFAFDGGNTEDSIDTSTNPDTAGGDWPAKACSRWASTMNTSRKTFGVTIAGEFSGAINDCGTFLKGTTQTSSAGNCNDWEDTSKWDAATVAGVKQLIMAQMDAFGDYFFWTWKVGNTSTHNRVESPLWSYQLGLQGGWIPLDPRTAVGKCASVGETGMKFDGTFESWQTGGAGAGTISGSSSWPWPPATISNANVPATDLPVYTLTGSIVSLPAPTKTGSTPTTISLGNGWFNPRDTASAPAEVSGCTYPNAWDAEDVDVPSPNCATAAPTR
jgi:glucan 1,3-beta-glucosidase